MNKNVTKVSFFRESFTISSLVECQKIAFLFSSLDFSFTISSIFPKISSLKELSLSVFTLHTTISLRNLCFTLSFNMKVPLPLCILSSLQYSTPTGVKTCLPIFNLTLFSTNIFPNLYFLSFSAAKIYSFFSILTRFLPIIPKHLLKSFCDIKYATSNFCLSSLISFKYFETASPLCFMVIWANDFL